jgi:hypothetical protein
VPLLLPLPGLIHNRLYTFRWLTLMVWLYFIEGVVRASGDRGTSALLARDRGRAVPGALRRCALPCARRLRERRKAPA